MYNCGNYKNPSNVIIQQCYTVEVGSSLINNLWGTDTSCKEHQTTFWPVIKLLSELTLISKS